jgi:hypothetical protein
MTGVFREGHNKPKPRNRGPMIFEQPRKPRRMRLAFLAVTILTFIVALFWFLHRPR